MTSGGSLNQIAGRLPDAHDLIRGTHHRAVVGQVERFLELRCVRERAVRAVLAGRVRIGVEPQLQRFFAHVRAPDLRPAKEETLLRREAVDLLVCGRGVFRERLL